MSPDSLYGFGPVGTNSPLPKRDDSGPAFPHSHDHGMSLRDWFAGQALKGIIAGLQCEPGQTVDDLIRVAAIRVYEVADAMLEARKAGKP